jgi:DNA-binding FadR family transcriptional regulator
MPYWSEIIDAICTRDPDRAEKALYAHAENVQEVMKAIAQEHKPFAVLYSNDA